MLTRAAARQDLYRTGLTPTMPLLALAELYCAECPSPLDASDAHYDGPSRAQAARHNIVGAARATPPGSESRARVLEVLARWDRRY